MTPVTTLLMHDNRVKPWHVGVGLLVLTLVGTGSYFLSQSEDSLRRDVQLSDGTRLIFRNGSHFIIDPTYPNPRHIQVDGDVFMSIPAAFSPMTVTSHLLKLDISGAADLRLAARSREAGEQVQVLCGNVIAHKNYPSSHAEPDYLTANTMSMVNQSIDLMEKETFSPGELTNWLTDLGLSTGWVRSQCDAMTQ